MAGVLSLVAVPAHGQSQSIYDTPATGSESVEQVPEWAESESYSSGAESQNEAFIEQGVQTKAPGLPDNPNRVPVDGGVALLAAAGAGYAVRKLNEEETDDDDVV